MSELKKAGKITKILQIESGTSKAGTEWRKQCFVLTTDDEYNPDTCFELFNDKKIQAFSEFKEGDFINVSFNVSSREWEGRYFHNVQAWKFEKLGDEPVVDGSLDKDDLPF